MNVMIGLLIVLLDMASCIYIYRLLKTKKINLPVFYVIFPIAIPVLGHLLFWMLSVTALKSKSSSRFKMSEKGLFDEFDDVKEIATRLPQQEQIEELIPLEEALLLKDRETSRKMLMEIVSRTPAKFIDLLYLARKNEDTEVVHYATTMIAEISRQYDLQLQDLDKRLQEAPEDLQVLTDYCDALADYLDKKLVSKRLEILLREEYANLLSAKLAQKESLADHLAFIDNELFLKRYEQAEQHLKMVAEKWPHQEEVYMLYMKYYYETKQGDGLRNLLESVKKDSVYISSANQELFAFWQN